MGNEYIITNIDPTTNIISVTFYYNGNSQNASLVLKDIADPNIISDACSSAYIAFSQAMDNAPIVPPVVMALVNVPVNQDAALILAKGTNLTNPTPING